MKVPNRLTDLQLELMDVVWEAGEASAGQVHEAVRERTGLARQTIGTMLARLEKAGVLTHRAEGREHVYRARVTREQVQRTTLQNVLDRLFGGSLPALISHALEAREVRPGDVERVREMIRAWEDGRESGA